MIENRSRTSLIKNTVSPCEVLPEMGWKNTCRSRSMKGAGCGKYSNSFWQIFNFPQPAPSYLPYRKFAINFSQPVAYENIYNNMNLLLVFILLL
jgi:hypothetical protein